MREAKRQTVQGVSASQSETDHAEPALNRKQQDIPTRLDTIENVEQQSSEQLSETSPSNKKIVSKTKKSKRSTLMKSKTINYHFEKDLAIPEEEDEVMASNFSGSQNMLNTVPRVPIEMNLLRNDSESSSIKILSESQMLLTEESESRKLSLKLPLNLTTDLHEDFSFSHDGLDEPLTITAVRSENPELAPRRDFRKRLNSVGSKKQSNESGQRFGTKRKSVITKGYENWDDIMLSSAFPSMKQSGYYDDCFSPEEEVRVDSAKSTQIFHSKTPNDVDVKKNLSDKFNFSSRKIDELTDSIVVKNPSYHHNKSKTANFKKPFNQLENGEGGETTKISDETPATKARHKTVFLEETPIMGRRSTERLKSTHNRVQEMYHTLKSLKTEIDEKRQVIKMCEVIKEIGKFITSQDFYNKSISCDLAIC